MNYNAYLQGGTRLTPNGANDLLVTTFNWQTNCLGSYYLPSSSPLVDAGSVANAGSVGLYHFTTQTNQTKEGTSRLDVGYHYVAVNGSGQPVDTDGDGFGDYFEDLDGDGNADSGEMSWLQYNSGNGLSSGAGLEVFTPLR
jgi:hypothetical protein